MDTQTNSGPAPSPNRGAALMLHFMAARGMTMTDMARALEVEWRTVHRWARGITLPALGSRERLAWQSKGAVPPEAWQSKVVADIDAARIAILAERAS